MGVFPRASRLPLQVFRETSLYILGILRSFPLSLSTYILTLSEIRFARMPQTFQIPEFRLSALRIPLRRMLSLLQLLYFPCYCLFVLFKFLLTISDFNSNIYIKPKGTAHTNYASGWSIFFFYIFAWEVSRL